MIGNGQLEIGSGPKGLSTVPPPAVRFLRLTVAYDGSAFFGWQRQPERRTVQQVLEDALASITGESRPVVAAGRTDTGVHALGQAVSYSTASRLPPPVLQRAVNACLPADVCVLAIDAAPDGFNAIDHALGKRYRYLIQDGRLRDLFVRQRAWRVPRELDVDAMQRAALGLVGTHDFAAYQNTGSPRVSTVRTVRDLQVKRSTQETSSLVAIEVEADGFLYNMVRNLVGTLVEVGKGKRAVAWPASVLASKQRIHAGMCAPPHGLYLLQVYYSF